MENIERLRLEFRFMIGRCGCSKAGTFIDKELADWMNAADYEAMGCYKIPKWKITPPSCTPSTCFPELTKLLYPNGGLNVKADMLRTSMVRFNDTLRPTIKDESEFPVDFTEIEDYEKYGDEINE